MSEFHRLHWVSSVTGVLGVLKQNLITFVFILIVGTNNSSSSLVWIVGIGILAAFTLGILGWLRFSYQLLEEEIHIKKGVFVQKNLYIHRNRVQVTEISAGIIQRVFGLVSLSIQTAGGGSERAVLSALSRTEATRIVGVLNPEQLQQTRVDDGVDDPELLADYSSDTYQDTLSTRVETTRGPVWELSNKHLLYLALTSSEFGIIATIIGTVLGQLSELITDENIEWLIDRLPLIQQPGLPFVLFSIGAIIIVSYILAIVASYLRFYGFKLEKKNQELVISRGLLERVNTRVPYHRIQAIRSTEGILRQPLGLEAIAIISAGHQQGQQQRSLLVAPLLLRSERSLFFEQFFESWEGVEGVSDTAIPDEDGHLHSSESDEDLEDLPQVELDVFSAQPPKKALLRYLRRPNYLWLLPVMIIQIWWQPILWFSLLVIPFTLYGWFNYKDTRLSVRQDYLYIRYRGVARKHMWIPKRRIQSLADSQHWFQKRKQLYHIQPSVVSGSDELKITLKDFSVGVMTRLWTWFRG